MKTAIAIVLILLLAALLAQVILARLFLAEVVRQEEAIRNAPSPERRDSAEIPEIMRRFAERGLAGEGGLPRAVRLTQAVEIFRGDRWSPLSARQHIATAEPGFAWLGEAAGWPGPSVRVIDRFTGGEGVLEVRLLGSLRAGRFDGPDADIGEAMRYLAELPWAPDAILSNHDIHWHEFDSGMVEAGLVISGQTVTVQFLFDEAGDAVEFSAQGRPDVSTGETVLRDWRGVFSDYGEISGRRIPFAGEVGYVEDGAYAPYFRARITSYELIR